MGVTGVVDSRSRDTASDPDHVNVNGGDDVNVHVHDDVAVYVYVYVDVTGHVGVTGHGTKKKTLPPHCGGRAV